MELQSTIESKIYVLGVLQTQFRTLTELLIPNSLLLGIQLKYVFLHLHLREHWWSKVLFLEKGVLMTITLNNLVLSIVESNTPDIRDSSVVFKMYSSQTPKIPTKRI